MLAINIIKAIVVRAVLLIHSLLAIWRVVILTKSSMYWWLAVGDVVLIVEAIITLISNKGMEYKWFCPCFLIYLGSTVPAIWLMELDRRDRNILKSNSTENTTTTNVTVNTTQGPEDDLFGLPSIYGISIPVKLEPDTWVIIIEQLLLYLMIISRWILPRGNISRNELSQLLFVFIGMASDITELFTLFDESPVRESIQLTYAILIIWTVSLIQFCFVLTATSSPKRTRVALKKGKKRHLSSCCGTEIWSIFVAMFMQDIPFLVVRTYTIATFNLITYSIIFFTAKNTLVILLLFYRVMVLCLHKEDEVSTKKSDTVVFGKDDGRKKRDSSNVPSVYSISKTDVHRRHKTSDANLEKTIGSL